ncbi:hypothetical protein IKE82_01715 [Candidatus Saccharibacteria bacterium]|nr:hypothetical protein [Candidatus Saccharibacteria bacterium]
MRKWRTGFTLVEVSLFLAVTGLLFLGVTIGVQNSIYQQRYNEAVQSFANFLRNVYDEVMNVQSLNTGRTDMAIYGKLISFGEANSDGEQIIYSYDVIGKTVNAGDLGSGTTLNLLKQLGADVVFREGAGQPYKPVGIIAMYRPSWGARIQVAEKGKFEDYKGEILIVRDPKSGTVRTLAGVGAENEVIEVNSEVAALNSGQAAEEEPPHILTDLLTPDNFSPRTVDFCVNPNGTNASDRRTDIRLAEAAMNASGVEVMPLDDAEQNKCNN